MRKLESPNLLPDFIWRNMEALGDFLGVRKQVARLVAQQQRGKRRIVIYNDAPFTVQDLTPRREDRHAPYAVLLSAGLVLTRFADLQTPQPIGKHQKDDQSRVLNNSKF